MTTVIQVLISALGSAFLLYLSFSGAVSGGSTSYAIMSVVGVVEGFLLIAILDFYPLYILSLAYGFEI